MSAMLRSDAKNVELMTWNMYAIFFFGKLISLGEWQMGSFCCWNLLSKLKYHSYHSLLL